MFCESLSDESLLIFSKLQQTKNPSNIQKLCGNCLKNNQCWSQAKQKQIMRCNGQVIIPKVLENSYELILWTDQNLYKFYFSLQGNFNLKIRTDFDS